MKTQEAQARRGALPSRLLTTLLKDFERRLRTSMTRSKAATMLCLWYHVPTSLSSDYWTVATASLVENTPTNFPLLFAHLSLRPPLFDSPLEPPCLLSPRLRFECYRSRLKSPLHGLLFTFPLSTSHRQ